MNAIGLLHPGEMGSSVGAAASGVQRVFWASEGRSPETNARAQAGGLVDRGTLEGLLGASEVVISVCPPDAALAQARDVAARGYAGLYVDANAISPATARRVGDAVAGGGARFVDGGIVGPPAQRAGTTRLYLAGEEAPRVAALFSGGPLEPIVLDGAPGSASALKNCFAAWTKGTSILLATIRALAGSEGVDADLLREWERSIPDLPRRSEGSARALAPKAWRFVGEMDEIAAGLRDAGLPDGFFRAAAGACARLAHFKDAEEAPSLADVTRALLEAREEEEEA